jgi:prophage tail gpP-like protein
MAFKQQEVAEVTVKGQRFRDWESVQVKLAEGESNNTFKLTVSEGKPLSSKYADLQIRPGDHCTITLAGQLAITGYVETRQVAYTAEQHGIEIIGVSFTKALVDGTAMTKNGNEFRDKSWKKIADEVAKPIKVVEKTGLNNMPFRRASIPPGMSKFDFLEMLARQRGITLGTDKEGNLTARMKWAGGGASLVEGVNILEGREVMSIKGGGPNDTVNQEPGYDLRRGIAAGTHGNKSSSTSNVNTGGKGVSAVNRQVAEHAGTKEETGSRSKMESQQRGAEQLQVTIVVQGWLKPGGGGLWQPGEKVHVKSPMLIVDEDLDLVSATFTQDSKSGTRTTLELKRPGGEGEEDKEGKYDVSRSKTDQTQSQTQTAPPRTGTPGGDTPF